MKSKVSPLINKPTLEKIKSSTFNLPKEKIDKLALYLCEKMEDELKETKRFSTKFILNLICTGALSLLELTPTKIIRSARPYLKDPEADLVWERFNIPYLKRILKRLEKQRLVTINEKEGKQTITINEKGRLKILRYAIDDIKLKKPSFWNGKWWIISYDLPEEKAHIRKAIRHYLTIWGFFPIHESVYLHAYPCQDEITFLKEYFSVGEYIRIFKVEKIENDKVFRSYFGI